jgi:hypothetical protein
MFTGLLLVVSLVRPLPMLERLKNVTLHNINRFIFLHQLDVEMLVNITQVVTKLTFNHVQRLHFDLSTFTTISNQTTFLFLKEVARGGGEQTRGLWI